MKINEKKSILKAYYNGVQKKYLENVSDPVEMKFLADKEKKEIIDKLYSKTYKEKNLKFLITVLYRTTRPEYITLARILERMYIGLSQVKAISKNQAMLVVREYSDYMSDRQIRTTYKEFMEIEKRAHKANGKELRKLNKVKEIKNFVYREMDEICYMLSGIMRLDLDSPNYDYEVSLALEHNLSEVVSYLESEPKINRLAKMDIPKKLR